MRINGVQPSKIVNLYNGNKKAIENSSSKSSKDSIEISSLGKSLSSISTEDSFGNSNEKIERIKKEISQGTYKADSKLTASKMIDIMKKRGI
ncbi:flagellar biosynthesis anti-sigma factor FlgM [Clostridiales bacterium oral taxon 876 str. F0540]|nr:flagellar biosynthesis anti-sigma factor FlgM [Clostridiales bacterium oral taxon 876 str. F0540]